MVQYSFYHRRKGFARELMIYGNSLLNACPCCGWEGRSLNISRLNLSYGKKARSLQVKYGAWQIELRPDRRGHFGDSQWAESSAGWKSASEFLITVSGGFWKGPPMSGRYTAAFFSLGDQPLLASLDSLEGERPARDRCSRQGRREEENKWTMESEWTKREKEAGNRTERLRERGKRERERVNLASKFQHQFWSPSSVSPTRCN